MLALVVLTLAGAVYLSSRIALFPFAARVFSSRRAALLGGAAAVAVLAAALFFLLGAINTAAVFLHLLAVWLVCDGLRLIFGVSAVHYRAGVAAICLSAAVLVFAWVSAHRVVRTEYLLETEKALPQESFKLVGFSDSHVGATFGGEKLNEYVELMNAENADAAVIVGDFVDDGSTEAELRAACRALAGLKTKYGVFYVFGNHDKAFDPAARGYGREGLVRELEKNGVTVLEDEAVTLCPGVTLVGRQDRSVRGRAEIASLLSGETGYVIVLDHQPTDFSAEAGAGADLVLSGHTHGGQLFPIGAIIARFNDRVYGHEKRGGTDFIVSSGIADWELGFKTGCVSEYFSVTVTQRPQS